MRSWQVHIKAHLCAACIIRAMPEKVPANSGLISFYNCYFNFVVNFYIKWKLYCCSAMIKKKKAV